MKILCVGDIHAKYKLLNQIVALGEKLKVNKLVFLGDYMDDWKATPSDNELTVDKLLELKSKDRDKYIFLFGNHDASNVFGRGFRCSGWKAQNVVAADKLAKLEMQWAVSFGDTLFTHAGLTKGWAKANNISARKASVLADVLNSLPPESYNMVGMARGGWEVPSPIWADATELYEDAYSVDQIVGHTPMLSITASKTVTSGGKEYNQYYCDTFSTYRNGENYGDSTLLLFNTEDYTMKKINLKGEYEDNISSWNLG